jgi:hypothetical protein
MLRDINTSFCLPNRLKRVISGSEHLPQHSSLIHVEVNITKLSTHIDALPIIDPIEEAKLVRRLDLFIIPLTMLLYLFSFLDR